MVKRTKWVDDYWLLVMQLYLRKPVGVKPVFARDTVELSLELHIPPTFLFDRMKELSEMSTPRIEHLWERYGKSPSRLKRAVTLLRGMKGFNNADAFYEGVEENTTFEQDFLPMEEYPELMPFMLVVILQLYFQLTPITMAPDTSEVIELSKTMKLSPELICDVMEVFQYCDPYLHREDIMITPLMVPCQKIWKRYGNMEEEELNEAATEYKAYFE